MKSFKDMRTDPHRPSVMDPSEYVYVGAADDHGSDSWTEMRTNVLRKYGITQGIPWYDATEDGRPNYRCHHCGKHGSNIRYFVFFLHKPTNVVITVGQICAKKLNLGTKEELDLQKRRDAERARTERNSWVHDFPDEYEFLRRYDEQHREGGRYNEFYESLWSGLQKYGSLTGNQTHALRNSMERWNAIDGDRKQGHVIRTEAEPTEAQLALIRKLCQELGKDVDMPCTRQAASERINALKVRVNEKRGQVPPPEQATERQLSFINRLLEERVLTPDARKDARAQFDAGLTRHVASRWIEKLLTLPEIGD